VIFNKAGH